MAEFDFKEYARQMRENAVKESDGVIRCSPELWEQIASIVENIPAGDVAEVKHGKWKVNVGMNFNKERICPICGEEIKGNHWNFCSNCGAKMDE